MRQLKISKSITNRESAALEKYLQEIARKPMVSAEEEAELARRIHKGDDAALNTLVNANLRFVVSVAKQYQSQGLSLLDLIDEGNLGLIKAAQKFDETKGFKFISYAVWWIRQSIMQALAEQSRMVRLPLNQVGLISKINKEVATYEQEHGFKPSSTQLAEILNLPTDKIEEALKSSTKAVSIDTPIGDDSDTSMVEMIPNSNTPATDSRLADESLSQEIDRALSTLGGRSGDILKKFFGLGCPAKTLEEIGEEFNLTRERVRQIKEKAIRQLRNNSKCKLLKSYLG